MAEPSDRQLVRLYWPVDLRPAFDALLAIDDAMGDVVARASEPGLAAIKLAWWRERLEELDQGKVPAEPRLQAAASELLPRGIGGASLGMLEEGWATLLQPEPDQERVADRGARLFAMAASLFGTADPLIETAGRLYAREHLRRNGFDRAGSSQAELAKLAMHRFPRVLRPVTALAALAARDARREEREPEATPGRALALLRHRVTGRLG